MTARMPMMIIDSYPELKGAKVRYCAMVSRDAERPRSRKALNGRGVQVLELRSLVCGTITSVQKDTLRFVQHEFKEV